MQILLDALRHKSDNSFAGAHSDAIFVGLLVMAWKGESLWVETVSCPVGGGGRWRQDWSRRRCISPTLVLVWWGCYCRRECHLWLSSWFECDSKHHIATAKSILDFGTRTRVILCCWLRYWRVNNGNCLSIIFNWQMVCKVILKRKQKI